MKIDHYIFLLFVAALLASCGHEDKGPDVTGTFEAEEIIVSSEATGKIVKLDVQEGMATGAGQTVGCVDTTQLHLRKMQLLASINAVESRRPDVRIQIAATEQQLATAKSEKARVEKLLEANAANRKQLDDVEAQVAVLERQLEAQTTSLYKTADGVAGESSALRIQAAQVDDLLAKCRITNPIDGVVIALYSRQNEVTASGMALYRIADLENMFLRAYVTGSQLTVIKLGQKVKVFSDFGNKGQREYEGTVAWISDKAEFTPKTVLTKDERADLVYAVKIRVKNDGYLKIGMYGGAKIDTL